MNKLTTLLIAMLIVSSCKNFELSSIAHSLDKIKNSAEQGSRSGQSSPDNDSSEDDQMGGQNPAPKVSCKKYCEDIDLFRQKEDDGYSYLSFPNFGHNGVGRCRGHALLTQKMTLLGLFTNSKRCDLEDIDCLAKYRKKIYSIQRFKYQKIPGFRNLKEFSDHPRIRPILRGIVAKTSHRYTAGKAHIEDTSYETLHEQYFHEIKRRLRLGHYPYIGVYGALTRNHGLIAYEETFKNGHNIICAKDPNVVLEASENCDNYFYLDGQEIFYHRVGREQDKLTKFQITKDEDLRVLKYEAALKNKCIKRSKAQDLCL